MKVIVDAMGSDNAPRAQVEGALEAVRRHSSLQVILVGPQGDLEQLVGRSGDGRVTVFHAPDVIEPGDEPVRAFRRKARSSMVVALRAVADGGADAAVSAGNTGALLAGGLFIIRRLPGVGRPALGTVIPTMDGRGVLFMDMGASVDSRAEHIVQHALMGAVYAREVMDRTRPRVALLNVGSEPGKGTQVIKDAYQLLDQASGEAGFEFSGNVEGRDLLAGEHDVIVADGFVGNVALKVLEGTAMGLLGMLRQEISGGLVYRLGALAMRPAFRKVYRRMDYAEYGGAPLLGLSRVVVKCHGSSNGRAVASGIRQAVHMIERDVPAIIGDMLASGKGDQ